MKMIICLHVRVHPNIQQPHERKIVRALAHSWTDPHTRAHTCSTHSTSLHTSCPHTHSSGPHKHDIVSVAIGPRKARSDCCYRAVLYATVEENR